MMCVHVFSFGVRMVKIKFMGANEFVISIG